MGLREEKKLKTRAAISLLATKLFIQRGYHAVTTAEIASQAAVSVPTLFKYFPTKESLVFDEDDEREQFLIYTIRERTKGQGILEALLAAGLNEIKQHHQSDTKAFLKLIRETPELQLYAQQMWLRHSQSLAKVIQQESRRDLSSIEAESIARFVLDAFHRAIEDKDPQKALKAMFKIIQSGWKG